MGWDGTSQQCQLVVPLHRQQGGAEAETRWNEGLEWQRRVE